jgi:basic membrane protein A and related proteins
LLIGARLTRYEAWAATTSLVLTGEERRYLDVSVARRDEERVANDARQEAEDRLRRRARRRLVGLAASLVVLVAVVSVGAVVLLAGPAAQVALLRREGDGAFERFLQEGIERVGRNLDVATEVVHVQADPTADIRGLCAGGAELVFVGGQTLLADVPAAVPDCPDTILALLDANVLEGQPACDGAMGPDECLAPTVVPVAFATEEASFLAGAAAARTTRTGVIGFLGGNPYPLIEDFRAGFEAGAHYIDPDVEVVAIFLTDSVEEDDLLAAYNDVDGGRVRAVQLHDAGADVVFAAAGNSGRGALLAAEEASTPDLPRWVIGADTDWALTEPGRYGALVLGSVLKRFDVAIEDVTRDLVAGELTPAFRRSGLAEGWVELSRRGGHLEAYGEELDALRDAIVDGAIVVPRRPTGPVLQAP